MNYQPMTELEAVNVMLFAVNEQPVNTLIDSGLSEVSQAKSLLHNISRDVQARGFNFNTETDYPLNPDINGYIYIPSNALKVDPVEPSINCVRRGNRLYDKTNHTFVFREAVDVDIVWFLPFEDLPQATRSYITVKAAREFQRNTIGSETLDSLSERDEYNAWLTMIQEEVDSSDYNLLTSTSMSLMLAR
jgi:hypothetical protein